MKNLTVCVVDDEKNIRRSFELILRNRVKSLQVFESGEALLDALPGETVDALFLDVQLPGIDGIETLKRLKEISPTTEVVMISGHATLSTAVDATRAGAYDFLEKPLQKEKIVLTLEHLAERQSLKQRFADLQSAISAENRIIGESPAILSVLQKVKKIAPTDSKVLITGESGVGKELVAFAIHQNSARAKQPFVKMNCAAIPEDLIESERFGSEKGAFTGATERRDGKFTQANGGTLFLDEVGDMSLRVQTKVLRVLQDGDFQRVGGKETLRADVRVVAATNRDLAEMVKSGDFREDLFFRLNVLPITVPPLRERREDIPLLVEHFAREICRRNDRKTPQFDPAVMRQLQQYRWAGNIRELHNLVERLIILAEGDRISVADLPEYLNATANPLDAIAPGSKSLAEVREIAERRYIERCLAETDGNVTQAAKLLGMERTNLHKKMKSLGIQ
ncbi:MAG: sigma-54 dependent transcriptional regulator [Calditrichia bacterium]